MGLKETLKERIPAERQTGDFTTLLKLIDTERIRSIDELTHHLAAEEKNAHASLGAVKAPTGNSKRRSLAKKLDFYARIRADILPHLT